MSVCVSFACRLRVVCVSFACSVRACGGHLVDDDGLQVVGVRSAGIIQP